jgi:GNAT superfamily N-acetyltransferase
VADEVLGGAGRQHRYVSIVDDALGQALRADFEAAGYEHETIAALIYTRPRSESAAQVVRSVSLDELRPAIMRDWRVSLPEATEEELRQLADRTSLYARAAELTLLAVFDGGVIASHASLCIDRVEGIAQFENLVTHGDFKGRGFGGALVHGALERAQQAGCELSFLTADVNDWPYRWYQRLGYEDAGRTHHFSRQVSSTRS